MKNKSIPLVAFQPAGPKGVFACHGGKTRLALSPDGEIWGCYLFWDYYKNRQQDPGYNRFCFGPLDRIIEKGMESYGEKLAHYADLRMDYFCMKDTPCFSCNYMEHCMVCPVDALFAGAKLGEVPPSICKINRNLIDYSRRFIKSLGPAV